jgi:hypothetical protein
MRLKAIKTTENEESLYPDICEHRKKNKLLVASLGIGLLFSSATIACTKTKTEDNVISEKKKNPKKKKIQTKKPKISPRDNPQVDGGMPRPRHIKKSEIPDKPKNTDKPIDVDGRMPRPRNNK